MTVAEFAQKIGRTLENVECASDTKHDMSDIWKLAVKRNDRTFLLFMANARGVLTDYQKMSLAFDLIQKTPMFRGGFICNLMDGGELAILHDAFYSMSPLSPNLNAAGKTRNFIFKISLDYAASLQSLPHRYAVFALRSALDMDLFGVGKNTFLAATAEQIHLPNDRKWKKRVRIEQAKIIAKIRNPFA